MARLVFYLGILSFIICSCEIEKTIEPLNVSEIKQFFITDSIIYAVRIRGWDENSAMISILNKEEIKVLSHNPLDSRTSILADVRGDSIFDIYGETENPPVDSTVTKLIDYYFKSSSVNMKKVNYIKPMIFDSFKINNADLELYNKNQLIEKSNINKIVFYPENNSNFLRVYEIKMDNWDVHYYKGDKNINMNLLKNSIVEKIFFDSNGTK